MVGFLWRACSDRRSVPGHIVRFIQGVDGMQQDLNDLAADIRNVRSMSQLQSWSMETLRRYQSGTLQTNGRPRFYWDDDAVVKLARQERPEFITQQWGEKDEYGQEEPEIFIVFSTNRQPEAVMIGWYSYGIRIGTPEYRMPYESSDLSPYMEVKPGVYVYANYK